MLSSSKCHVGIFRLTLRNISSHSIVCLHAHLWLHTNHFHLRITFPWLGNKRKMGSVYFTWEGKTVSAQFMNAVLVAISRSNWSFYFRYWAMFAITFRLFSMFSLKHLNAGQTLKKFNYFAPLQQEICKHWSYACMCLHESVCLYY